MVEDIERMAMLWNAGWNTQEIARRIYGLGAHESLVYARIDLMKTTAKRMRRAASDFDGPERTSPGGGLRRIER